MRWLLRFKVWRCKKGSVLEIIGVDYDVATSIMDANL
jgi:hypothetical protein